MAGCDAAPLHVDDYVAVQPGRTQRLDVEDLRATLSALTFEDLIVQ